MKSGVSMTFDKLAAVAKGVRTLGEQQVLVGIPEAKTERAGNAVGITNAALGAIHDKGAPEANIPARPWSAPGIKAAEDQIADRLKQTASAVLSGSEGTAERGLGQAGQIAVNSMQARIREGIPPPLAPATIAARRRRGKGSSYRRKAASASDTTPLIDTGALLRSLTWILRKRGS